MRTRVSSLPPRKRTLLSVITYVDHGGNLALEKFRLVQVVIVVGVCVDYQRDNSPPMTRSEPVRIKHQLQTHITLQNVSILVASQTGRRALWEKLVVRSNSAGSDLFELELLEALFAIELKGCRGQIDCDGNGLFLGHHRVGAIPN